MSAYERAMYREAERRRMESQLRTMLWVDVIIPVILVLVIWGLFLPLMIAMGPAGFAALPIPVAFTLLIGEVVT